MKNIQKWIYLRRTVFPASKHDQQPGNVSNGVELREVPVQRRTCTDCIICKQNKNSKIWNQTGFYLPYSGILLSGLSVTVLHLELPSESRIPCAFAAWPKTTRMRTAPRWQRTCCTDPEIRLETAPADGDGLEAAGSSWLAPARWGFASKTAMPAKIHYNQPVHQSNSQYT